MIIDIMKESVRREVTAEAERHGVGMRDVHRVLQEAYDTHKKEHGSFRPLMHQDSQEYEQRMHERYWFTRNEAMKYIQEHSNILGSDMSLVGER